MNKISISALDKIMHDCYTETAELDWHGEKLVVKRTLSLESMLQFVDGVVKSCFSKDTHEYIPEARDFALLSSIAAFYTNVETSADVQQLYALLYQTDLIPTVLGEVNDRQFNEMMAAIDRKLRALTESDAERIARQMNTAIERINELAQSVEELFAGVSAEDILKLSTAVANSELDTDKIVQLVLDERNSAGERATAEEAAAPDDGE